MKLSLRRKHDLNLIWMKLNTVRIGTRIQAQHNLKVNGS